MKQNWLKLFFKILVSLATMGLILKWIDLSSMLQLLSKVKTGPLLAAISIAIFLNPINAVKLLQILKLPYLSVWPLTKFNFIKMFFLNLLPGGISGEVVRVYYLGRFVNDHGKALSAVFIDRLTGFWFQSTLVFVSAIIIAVPSGNQYSVLIVGMVSLPLCVFFSIWLFPLAIKLLDRLTGLFFKNKTSKILFKEVNQNDLTKLIQEPYRLIMVIMTGITFHILIIFMFMILANALGQPVSFYHSALFLFLHTLISLLPVSIGGWGINEALLGILFSAIGAQAETGVMVSLLIRAIMIPSSVIGAVFYLFQDTPLKNGVENHAKYQ